MKKIIYPSNMRGEANHGWLHAKHSFSFANYYDPKKMNFGALRVLNDDIVAPGMGFGTHPHNNMEIITIPLSGSLEHKDSMGHSTIIHSGEIQVMSAGSGITHSEFNASKSEEINLFQLWIFPNKQNVEPRYDQFKMDSERMKNNFLQLVSPNQSEDGTWINQEAWIHIAKLDEKTTLTYQLKNPLNGVYIIVIYGEIEIKDEILKSKDAIGIWETESISCKSLSKSKLLVVEIPMSF